MGQKGSFRLWVSGPKRGRWLDFEAGESGDILSLIRCRHCGIPSISNPKPECEFRSIVIIDSGDPDHGGDDGADRLPLTVFNRG